MKTLAAFLAAIALALPAAAQTRRPAPPPRRAVAADDAPKISYRPFFVVTGQQFTARQTFDAVFGAAFQPFYGGGLEVALKNGLFVDAAVLHFSKDGHRAFFFENQAFNLGIPLSASVTAFEATGGYRFLRVARRMIPYAGAGVGSYGYKETSTFADPTGSENVDTRHVGFLAVGGAEFRIHRWVGASVDAQYTSITGILGSGGVSKEAGENNLGGIAVRVRVIVGR